MPKKKGKGKKKKGSSRFNREAMRKQFQKKAKDHYESRDDSGKFGMYFKPDTVKLWTASKDEHTIDILPYEIGSHHPVYDKGDWDHILYVFTHRNVGPTDDMVICPALTYKKDCPICEEERRLRDEGEEDAADELKASKRNVMNIIVRDGGKEEKKGVQQFEIAHWFMGKHLAKIAHTKKGEVIYWDTDGDVGKQVVFERTGTGKENTGYDGHRLEDRDYDITDEELEQCVCLDDALIIHSYEELQKMIGVSSDDEDIEDEDYDEDEGTEDDDDDDTDDTDSDYEDEDDDEGDDSDDDDDDEDDEDDEPVKRPKKKGKGKKKKSKEPVCPEEDGEFGVDTDAFDECEDCPLYDDCTDEYERRKAERKKKKGKGKKRK